MGEAIDLKMHYRQTLISAIFACVACNSPGSTITEVGPSITAVEAVSIAETFVRRNGYTTDVPSGPIAYESLEWSHDDDTILKSRYGTLQSKAYGFSQTPDGWMVIFRYTSPQPEIGRAVTMTTSGMNLKVGHQDVYLRSAQVVLKENSNDP